MKKFWKEELTLAELNHELKKAIKKLNRTNPNKTAMLLSFVAILALIGILVFVVMTRKHNNAQLEDSYDDTDDVEEIDENGCRYTSDDDFE